MTCGNPTRTGCEQSHGRLTVLVQRLFDWLISLREPQASMNIFTKPGRLGEAEWIYMLLGRNELI